MTETIFEISKPGRRAFVAPALDVPEKPLDDLMPKQFRRTDYARETLCALEGVSALHEQPVVREFAVTLDAPVREVLERCWAEGVNPGSPLGEEYGQNGLLIAITEQRSRADIDRLAQVLGAAVRETQGVAA